jgi:nucleotide-binding universal stress UspA family protein
MASGFRQFGFPIAMQRAAASEAVGRLVGCDRCAHAQAVVLMLGRETAASGAMLTGPYTPIEYKKHAQALAEKVLGTVSAAATSAGVECETLHIEHEHIHQAIIDAAEARRCDLIVMASHGRRGVSAVVLGSETVKVLTHSKIPVLVYR